MFYIIIQDTMSSSWCGICLFYILYISGVTLHEKIHNKGNLWVRHVYSETCVLRPLHGPTKVLYGRWSFIRDPHI